MNVVVLRGTLSRPAERRQLPSGDTLVAYEVTTRDEEGKADTVPVVWLKPVGKAAEWQAGDDVVVAGRVRRRYFRAAGTTQSRTEVVADGVVPASNRKRADQLLEQALKPLGTWRTG